MKVLRSAVGVGTTAQDGLVTAKLASMGILGGSAMVCCLVPVFLARRCAIKGSYMDYLLRFGGGILLATTFLHLLPEVREGVEAVTSDAPWLSDLHVQAAELLMCLGFFMMYGIEEMAHKFLGHSHSHGDSDKSPLHDEQGEYLLKSKSTKLYSTLEGIQKEFLKLSDESYVSSYDSEDDIFTKESVIFWNKMKKDGDLTEKLIIKSEEKMDTSSTSKKGDKRPQLSQAFAQGTPLRAILITMALSIHQLFEGLAVGLESHASQVWILTGAITAHKVVIALCVGAEVAKAPVCGAAVLVGVFTLATPLGISMGLVLSEGAAMAIVSVLLQGLACGTLLYVVFFEVLSRQQGVPAFGHFVITAVGFIVMFVLLYFFES